MASVDDLDELIATRRLNGLNDNLYKESDKNVASEEIDLTTVYMKGYADAEEKYRARIKELEDDLYIADYTAENSIPIKKINDQIEKYEHMLALTTHGEIQKYTPGEIILKIDTLKEILEGK